MIELWDEAAFAAHANISRSTIQKMRVRGDGPMFVKLGSGRGGSVRYRPEDVREWLAEKARRSTSHQQAT